MRRKQANISDVFNVENDGSLLPDQMNLNIMSSRDWGANPGPAGNSSKVPNKPRQAHPIKEVSPRNLRDRNFIERIEKGSHLPQPPPGKIFGHGLIAKKDFDLHTRS